MAESKKDSGPFVRVESRQRTKGRAVRAEIAEARGSAILASVAELQEKDHGGHLIVTRTGMLESLDAIYGQQLREGGIKDTNKRRAVREAMREELEELLEARRRAGGLSTSAVDPEQVESPEVLASVAIELRAWSRRWLGGRQ